jgi:hypothetical protein
MDEYYKKLAIKVGMTDSLEYDHWEATEQSIQAFANEIRDVTIKDCESRFFYEESTLNGKLIWAGMEKQVNDHELICTCKHCLINLWLDEIKENANLHKILEKKEQRWRDLPKDEINTMWEWHKSWFKYYDEVVNDPAKTNELMLVFAKALSERIRHRNFEAFCYDARFDGVIGPGDREYFGLTDHERST